eukprot:280913-Chlamydomonas_euryale.AAC.1
MEASGLSSCCGDGGGYLGLDQASPIRRRGNGPSNGVLGWTGGSQMRLGNGHTHGHIGAHARSGTHAAAHAHAQAHARTGEHARLRLQMHRHRRSHMHARECMRLPMYMHRHMHARESMRDCDCKCTCTHGHAHERLDARHTNALPNTCMFLLPVVCARAHARVQFAQLAQFANTGLTSHCIDAGWC